MCLKRPFLWMAALPLRLLAQGDGSAEIRPDDPVLARLDDLSQVHWLKNDPFTADTALLNTHGFAPAEVPTWDEQTYRHRLAVLDERTPLSLTYNQPVQAYIDLYAVKKREQTSRMLGLAQLYFPLFEEYLDRYHMPLELKYLAVVESALNPGARSRAGAVGLWQFMVATGKLYGLDVNSYVDERCDVHLSTEAACAYLNYLHGLYDNWELALAAYNCGPGNVNRAIRRAGGVVDYWKIYDYLPRETRGYVPAFIAVNYIFDHAADHNLYPVAPVYCAYEVDSVQVCYPLDLDLLAKVTGTDAAQLRELNPVYKLGRVPDVEQPATVYLPSDAVGRFVSNEAMLAYSYKPTPQEALAITAPPATRASTHVVRRGESLGSIANKNRVTVAQLRAWNDLRSDRIQPGQRLTIQRPAEAVPTATVRSSNTARIPSTNPAGNDRRGVEYIYHTIQPGDTLWDIARKNGLSVDDLRRLNDGLNSKQLHPGRKIKVGVQEG